MNYSENFKELVFNDKCPNFVGWGNPNAKILILGKEPAIDMNTEHGRMQYETEVNNNRQDWRNNIANHVGFDEVFDKYSDSRLYGNPLYPHCWQKYQVKNRRNGVLPDGHGTSRTWYQYQKLINMIIGRESTRNDNLDFHKYCFSTDMSSVAALNSLGVKSTEKEKSIQDRTAMFTDSFFSDFPIVIAAVGWYCRTPYWWSRISEIFGVNAVPVDYDEIPIAPYVANEGHNINSHRLFISSWQFAAPISDELLFTIAGIVNDFAKKYDINLMPDLM